MTDQKYRTQDIELAQKNPNNVAEDNGASHFHNKKTASVAEKFTKSINVRLVNYTHSTTMATFIAVITLAGFALLLYGMMTECPVEVTTVEVVYNGGVLPTMQMDFISKIVKPDNLEVLQKAREFKRTADICIIRAAINVAVKADSVAVEETRRVS